MPGAHIGEAKEWAMEHPELAEMRYINGYGDPETPTTNPNPNPNPNPKPNPNQIR